MVVLTNLGVGVRAVDEVLLGSWLGGAKNHDEIRNVTTRYSIMRRKPF